MNDSKWPNLAAMFFEQAARNGPKPFLWAKRDGQWRPLSWRETAAEVSALAGGLVKLGVAKGERVILVSENRPEWLIADLAIMAIGAVTVPAYTTNTTADHLHIINDSGAIGAIISTARLAADFLPAAVEAGSVEFAVAMEKPEAGEYGEGLSVHGWDEALDRSAAGIEQAAAAWGPDDVACIIYTSGTGGAPKGVMLHHGAILHNCEGARDALFELGLGDEVFLSFLPLSHSYEHTAGQFFPISIGAQIYYAEGIDSLGPNMVETRPTIMTAVPRLYEMMHSRIMRGIEKQGGLKKALFMKALELGRSRHQNPGSLNPLQRIADAVLDKLVRDKVRARFGGRLKAMVSGGAPLNPDIGMFFTGLGLTILQGYGQTESAPVISVNRPGRVRMDTVGPPMKEVEVRIAGDGEILVRGQLVMKGYWKNGEATNQAIRDGWLHTGDIGELDEDGYLKITDRKKDIIVNSGGDNISPQRIEGLLTMQPEIAQAMVYGDRHPYLVALLVADAEWAKAWASENSKPGELKTLAGDRDFLKALGGAVERVNKGLSNIERVRRQMAADEPFSVENGQMTPTMKVRRHKLKEAYGEALEGLYPK
ncbi:MAG: AMP-dependent synthetase/ligase [Rhodospirillales bacterium]